MPRKSALSLTKLESEVMAVVWHAQPDPVSVRDVVEGLNQARAKTRGKQLAYNTIQTVMTLLKQKKAIRQVRNNGLGQSRAHFFEAAISRDAASRHVLSELSSKVFGGEVKPLIHQLIDDANFSTEDLAELRKWVDSKLNDSKRTDAS